MADQPLDRWSGDGVFPPTGREALLVQERAWRVDINDGVRVNVAPLQAAGLFASDVLDRKTCPKPSPTALAGAATSAAGSTPASCPGADTMDDSVPESPRWTELAPEREAERVRLEEKRKVALGQTGG